VKNAVPVPVPEGTVSKDQTIPTATELHGSEGGEASGVEPAPELPPLSEEEEPPPFRPVQVFPRIIRSAPPVYPELAVRAGVEGRVIVSVWVDKEGKPHEVWVAYSTNEIFNEAALEAARKYLFTPGCMSTGPVSVWVTLGFTFRLTNKR
jgi:protein TonB